MSYWWCIEHKKVEQGGGCGSTTRIGPYDTEPQAAGALERIHQREEDQVRKDEEEKKKWGKKSWF